MCTGPPTWRGCGLGLLGGEEEEEEGGERGGERGHGGGAHHALTAYDALVLGLVGQHGALGQVEEQDTAQTVLHCITLYYTVLHYTG